MVKQRKRYTREFKLQAVELTLREGATVDQVAEELGINAGMLSRWRVQLAGDPDQAFPGSGRLKERDAELSRLRRELAQARMESEILKKALAVFSRERE